MATKEEELAAIQQQVNEEMQKFGRILPDTQARLMDAQTGIKNFGFKVDATTKVMGKLADAVSHTASSMYKGEKGAAAFNQSVSDMSDALQIAATGLSLLIPGGPIMKAVVAGLTYLGTSAIKAGAELTKTANEQSDALYTAFQKMSKSGAAASDGMSGVFDDVQKLGLGIQDLDGYINLINESSRDLVLFKGSVFAGRQAFADMNKQMEPFTEQLYNAGMSQQDITKGAMSYLRLQTQIGRSQTQTTQQLAEGAKRYLIEQDALTKLTGQSRQEAEAEMEAARNEQRFRAKLDSLRNSGDARQIAAADELEKANRLVSSQSKEAGQAFRDLSTGMITTEAAQKGLIGSNGVLLEQANKLASGQTTAIDAVQQLGTAFGQNAKDLNALGQAGIYEDISIKYSDAVKLGIFANKDLAAEYANIQTDLEKQGVTGKKAQDELQQTQTEIRMAQKNAMLATQALVEKAVPAATTAMLKLAQAAEKAATALGGGVPGGTLHKTGIEAIDKQVLAERASPEFAEYQRNQERIKRQQEEAARKFAGQPAPAAPAAPAAAPTTGGAIPGGGQITNPNAPNYNATYAEYMRDRGEMAPAPAAPAPTQRQTAPPMAPSMPFPMSVPNSTAPAQPAKPTAEVTSYSDRLLKYIKSTERFTPTAFWDSRQWTNGYGTKAKTPAGGKDDPGPRETIDEGTAISRMTDFLQNAVSNVISYGKKKGYNWGQGQIDALTSFSYNAGMGILDKLTDRGKRSDAEIAAKLTEYNKAKSNKTGELEVNPGLVRRRQEELSMFQQARDGGVFDGPKSGYPMTLHGPEAVIPLKDGMVPVSMNDNGTMAELGGAVKDLKDAMIKFTDQMQRQQPDFDIQEQILTVLTDISRSGSATATASERLARVAAN